MLVARGQLDEARPFVMRHLPDPEAEAVHASIEVGEWKTSPGSGPLADARRAAAAGRWRDGLEGMLAAMPTDRDAARQAMITVFATLGDENELVPEFRRRLAAALF